MDDQKPKPVIVVNHGNVFNTGAWYTFYCPSCLVQVYGRQDVCKCSQKIEWPDLRNIDRTVQPNSCTKKHAVWVDSG